MLRSIWKESGGRDFGELHRKKVVLYHFLLVFFAIHPGTVVDVRLYRFYKLKVYFTGGEKRRLRDGGGTRNKNPLTLSYYPDLATYSCIINKFNPDKHFIPCTSLHWIVLACRAEYNSTRSVKKYVQE